MVGPPFALTDPRRWHWGKVATEAPVGREELARLLAISSYVVIRIQVAGIYFHAATAKFRVEEWVDGTAVYYWFTHPSFGMAPWLEPLVMPLLTNPITVSLLTWGALLLEVFLFTGLVIEKRYRRWLLILGITFHAGIALIHGLISFGLAMWAALILYLRPFEDEFEFGTLRASLSRPKPFRFSGAHAYGRHRGLGYQPEQEIHRSESRANG